MSNIVPIAYRWAWTRTRPSARTRPVEAISTIAALSTKRIHDARIGGPIDRFGRHDRRRAHRPAQVRAPQLLSRVGLECLGGPVEALNADEPVRRERRRGDRTHRPRFPQFATVALRQRMEVAVTAAEEHPAAG